MNGTFFHSGTGRFFGRTAKLGSIEIGLTQPPQVAGRGAKPVQEVYATSGMKKSFYFNSKVSEKEKVQLILELVIHEIDQATGVIFDSYGKGWTFVSPFNTCQKRPADIYEGTPRILSAFASQPKLSKCSASLEYSVASFPALGALTHLMPHMLLFSSDDQIPGLLDGFLPHSPSNVPKIELEKSFVVFAENISVKVPRGLLKEVLDAINEHQRELLAGTNSSPLNGAPGGASPSFDIRGSGFSQANFKELRLVCFYHNGFTATNKKQYGNYVILLDETNEYTDFKFIGNIGIDNVFNHDSAYFVAQLEAVFSIGLGHNQFREEKVALGWAPLALPSIQNASRSLFPLEEMMIVGPGVSVAGDRLFESLSRDESGNSLSQSRIMDENKIKLQMTLNLEQLVLNPSSRVSNRNSRQNQQNYQSNPSLAPSDYNRVPGNQRSQLPTQSQFNPHQQIPKMNYGPPPANYGNEMASQQNSSSSRAPFLGSGFPSFQIENQASGTFSQAPPPQRSTLPPSEEGFRNKQWDREAPPPPEDQISQPPPPDTMNYLSPEPSSLPLNDASQFQSPSPALTGGHSPIMQGSHLEGFNQNSPQVSYLNQGPSQSQPGFYQNGYQGPVPVQIQPVIDEKMQKEIEELRLGQQKLLDLVYNIHQTNEWNKYIGTTEYNEGKMSRLEKLKSASMAQSKMKSSEQNAEEPIVANGMSSTGAQQNFVPKELSLPEKEIPRSERMNLYEKAFNGLLDDQLDRASGLGEFGVEMTARQLQQELEDAKKASECKLQFMVMRFGTNMTNSHVPPPERVIFSFTFFDQPHFQTEVLTFEEAKSQQCKEFGGWHKFALASNEPMILNREMFLLHGEEPKYPVYRFEIDPSDIVSETNEAIPGRFTRFINYLHSKSLIIDVFDATSLMFYGMIRVPLRGLLRKNQESVLLSKEYSVINPVSNEFRGSIQLMVRHTARNTAAPCPFANDCINNPHENPKGLKGGNSHHSKSFAPMNYDPKLSLEIGGIKPQQQSSDGFSRKNPFLKIAQGSVNEKPVLPHQTAAKSGKEKKLEMIGRYKQSQINQASLIQQESLRGGSSSFSFSMSKLGMTQKDINKEIKIQKELKKAQIISDLGGGFTPSFSSTIISLSSIEGECQIFPFTVHNHLDKEYPVSVLIREVGFRDPEKKCPLSLITDPSEWRHWINKKRINPPPEFDMITKENGFIIRPNERVTLLFKYQRFTSAERGSQAVVAKKGMKWSSNLNKTDQYASPPTKKQIDFVQVQSFEVSIMDANCLFMEGFTVRAYLAPSTPDHKFKYFLPENKREEIILPSLTTKNHELSEEASRPIFRCSHEMVAIRWDENEKRLVACLKVPSAPSKQEFSIFAFKDTFLTELMGHWCLEINALKSHSDEYKIGFRQRITLNLDGGTEPRSVRIFTDHPKICILPSESRGKVLLMAGTQNKLGLIVRPTEVGDSKVRVNVVDDRSKELIGAWVIGIRGELPSISKVSKFDVIPNESASFIIEYQSSLSTKSIFSFESSNTNLVRVIPIPVPS